MGYDGPERRRDSLSELERKLDRLCSHMESEVGGQGTKGNLYHHMERIEKLLVAHMEKFDHIMIGNGKPGIMTRIVELETAHKNHQQNIRYAWGTIVALVVTQLYKIFTMSFVK